jgi:hypothetical protein
MVILAAICRLVQRVRGVIEQRRGRDQLLVPQFKQAFRPAPKSKVVPFLSINLRVVRGEQRRSA